MDRAEEHLPRGFRSVQLQLAVAARAIFSDVSLRCRWRRLREILTATSASGNISISGPAASSSIRPTSRSISISISVAIATLWGPLGWIAAPDAENKDIPIRCTSMLNRYVNILYTF